MTLTESDSMKSTTTAVLSRLHRNVGAIALATGALATGYWMFWRVTNVPLNAMGFLILILELTGVAAGIAVAVGLLRVESPRDEYVDDALDPHRYGFAVADLVGRTRSNDLHRDVRVMYRTFRSSSHVSADYAMVGVLLDGPRRLTLVGAVVFSLLFGVTPITVPPIVPALAGLVGIGCVSIAHVVLGRRRLRFGDRTRWSCAALGEVIGRADHDGLAPRRWIGIVATVVAVNIATALRGISDRWTHGLPPMGDAERAMLMLISIYVVLTAMYTLATTDPPEIENGHLVSRHLEERTARKSAVGAALALGLVGLVAGIFPGGVDAARDDSVRVESTVDRNAGDVPVDVEVIGGG
jgi:hypothetical protein